ncbi:MAG: hypothetical protein HKN91_11215 [Acidimicrobiia bacterium]|nr:hypothetical protein [Acidimicrobiia bacterium]
MGDAKLAISELVSAVIESGATDVEIAITCESSSCHVDVSPLDDAARGVASERLDVAHALFDSLDFAAASARFVVVAQTNA